MFAVPHKVSRPPSYRSRASDIIPIHGRHPSQLSCLSFAGGPAEPTLVGEETKDSTQHGGGGGAYYPAQWHGGQHTDPFI